MHNQKLIVILGPTASGKTEVSLELAKKILNCYIVSADSRQIYQGMDIGTGKLTNGKYKVFKGPAYAEASAGKQKVLHFQNIPHYMINILEPSEEYTLAQYQKKVKEIIQKNAPMIPILVGGTGLYISAIIDGFAIPTAKPDNKLRERLEKETNEELLEELKKRDLKSAIRIDPKNKRRLIRALEVCLKTGKTFSELRQKVRPDYEVLQIGINVPREELYKRIDQRVDRMIKKGLVDEVKELTQKLAENKFESRIMAPQPLTFRKVRGLWSQQTLAETPSNSPLVLLRLRKLRRDEARGGISKNRSILNNSIGYQEIISYLNGAINLEQAIELIKKNTRDYAKRQMTWFKRNKRIKWVENFEEAEKLIKGFLE